MIAFVRRLRAIARMSRHERWRVRMGCPGVPHDARLASGDRIADVDAVTPRRGEVYCRCARCHADRATAGWEPLT